MEISAGKRSKQWRTLGTQGVNLGFDLSRVRMK
jgi:hypothetical protein